MTRRLLWLELEGGAAVDIHSVARSNAAWQGGEPYEDLPVPPGARTVTAVGPLDRPATLFAHPPVLRGLRELRDAGVELVWNSRWLATPDRLRALADELGLGDVVRLPSADELPVAPNQDGIGILTTPYWEHWKVRASSSGRADCRRTGSSSSSTPPSTCRPVASPTASSTG